MRKIPTYDEVIKIFNDDQRKQIEFGILKGLNFDLYYNPEFDHLQMEEIALGLYNGLSEDNVKFYANPKFNWKEMQLIRLALEKGLTMNEIKEMYFKINN